jgi:hypothetical protein
MPPRCVCANTSAPSGPLDTTLAVCRPMKLYTSVQVLTFSPPACGGATLSCPLMFKLVGAVVLYAPNVDFYLLSEMKPFSRHWNPKA